MVCLWQPASAAAAASVMSRGVRVMFRPFAASAPPVKPSPCLLSKRDIRFVDGSAGRQQRAAHPHRTDGPRVRLPSRSFGLDREPVEPPGHDQRGATSDDQRAERAAGRARRCAGRLRRDRQQRHRKEEMTGARGRTLLILAALSIAALAAAALSVRGPKPLPPRPASERPTLLVLTSLPLVFGEDFSLQS